MIDRPRRLLFSVTLADCDIEHFCTGGPGGQAQNKKATGVRIRHRASGAVGEGREHRSQRQNLQAAWKRMSESPVFQVWNRKEAARLMGQKSADQLADEAMAAGNVRTEVKDTRGLWVVADPKDLKE